MLLASRFWENPGSRRWGCGEEAQGVSVQNRHQPDGLHHEKDEDVGQAEGIPVENENWPNRIGEADFIIFTCPLNAGTRHMFNDALLPKLKTGLRVVNVSRGPVIEERALLKALDSGIVHSAALDVFEIEPLSADAPLRKYDKCIFGSHNGSNSVDAVRRVSRLAIEKIARLLSETAR
jgi:D-3-phosphoglycerate dehydrogenase